MMSDPWQFDDQARARRNYAYWLREGGAKYKEIGERLGVSASRARVLDCEFYWYATEFDKGAIWGNQIAKPVLSTGLMGGGADYGRMLWDQSNW
jgi:hypothetical protein